MFAVYYYCFIIITDWEKFVWLYLRLLKKAKLVSVKFGYSAYISTGKFWDCPDRWCWQLRPFASSTFLSRVWLSLLEAGLLGYSLLWPSFSCLKIQPLMVAINVFYVSLILAVWTLAFQWCFLWSDSPHGILPVPRWIFWGCVSPCFPMAVLKRCCERLLQGHVTLLHLMSSFIPGVS